MTNTNNDARFGLVPVSMTSTGSAPRPRPNPTAGGNPSPRGKQGPRLQDRFAALERAILEQRVAISSDAPVRPELILAIDLATSVTTFRAIVATTPGLEFLGDFDRDMEKDTAESENRPAIEPDEQLPTGSRPTLYVAAGNQSALEQILILWRSFVDGDRRPFRHGLAPWRQVFGLIVDIREWGPSDRVADADFSAWRRSLDSDESDFHAEIELWYRESFRPGHEQHEQELLRTFDSLGVQVLDQVAEPAINYVAYLVKIDASTASALLDLSSPILEARAVAHVRPQAANVVEQLLASPESFKMLPAGEHQGTSGPPQLLLIDGVPDLTHPALDGRVVLVDALSLSSQVPRSARIHGTGMASSIIYGDLHSTSMESLERPLLLAPLFTAAEDVEGDLVEAMPHRRLPVSATKEIIDAVLASEFGSSIRIVVLAAGHMAQPYRQRMSPWARLLDYYSAKYGLCFIVSAGNRLDSELVLDRRVVDGDDIRDAVLRDMRSRRADRGVLSPAESVNALTVGAAHADLVPDDIGTLEIDVLPADGLPSPVSRGGGGHRGSIKPDVLAPGGRIKYRMRLDDDDDAPTVLDRVPTQAKNGIYVAVPTADLNADGFGYMLGTSVATGLIAHEAGLLLEKLTTSETASLSDIDAKYLPAVIKALLVNTASWGSARPRLESVAPHGDWRERRGAGEQLLGYGNLRSDRVAQGAAHRITLISTGSLLSGRQSTLRVPMPSSLNGRRDWRRASATLTWITTTNSYSREYRRQRLSFELANRDDLGLVRQEALSDTVRRGSVQHEHFDGDSPIVVTEERDLVFQVNSRPLDPTLLETSDFALVVTFEVEASTGIPVYSEVVAALRTRARAVVGSQIPVDGTAGP